MTTGTENTNPTLQLQVKDIDGEISSFASTGLHEVYTYTYNDYTGELTVERVSYGPRGTDEWARTAAVVVAAWPDGGWDSVTVYSGAIPR